MRKILIIRFSSIGDIVLTTPVMRCIKTLHPNCELHFVTKDSFKAILTDNTFIDKVFSFKNHINEIIKQLKEEQYDFIIDLHNNLRSALIKNKLGVPSQSVNKLNIEKWLLVNFKINNLPDVHIVNRYMKCIPFSDAIYDGNGLDYFIPDSDNISVSSFPDNWKDGFYSFAIGANHATKRLPADKIAKIIITLNIPVVLLGGKSDAIVAEQIKLLKPNLIFNACGLFNLNQSACIIKQSRFIISHDTGLMHIASALEQRIISVWGNTVPSFGMYPLLPEGKGESIVVENKTISCRPCSKIGYDKCPKHHFNCMNELDFDLIISTGKKWWQNN